MALSVYGKGWALWEAKRGDQGIPPVSKMSGADWVEVLRGVMASELSDSPMGAIALRLALSNCRQSSIDPDTKDRCSTLLGMEGVPGGAEMRNLVELARLCQAIAETIAASPYAAQRWRFSYWDRDDLQGLIVENEPRPSDANLLTITDGPFHSGIHEQRVALVRHAMRKPEGGYSVAPSAAWTVRVLNE